MAWLQPLAGNWSPASSHHRPRPAEISYRCRPVLKYRWFGRRENIKIISPAIHIWLCVLFYDMATQIVFVELKDQRPTRWLISQGRFDDKVSSYLLLPNKLQQKLSFETIILLYHGNCIKNSEKAHMRWILHPIYLVLMKVIVVIQLAVSEATSLRSLISGNDGWKTY